VSIRNILYVCTGNVFRSPVAAKMTEQLLGSSDIKVESAGMIEYNDEPLPEEMVDLARRHGVDLSTHVRRQVNSDLVHAADLVLVFDNGQVGELVKRFPEAKGKTYSIKDYAGFSDGKDMEDLWRKSVDVFERFIRELSVYLERCVNRVKSQKSAEDWAVAESN
jgi:protein-tyrosine-phosphatase